MGIQKKKNEGERVFMSIKKIYIVILILVMILFLSASALSKCGLTVTENNTGESGEENGSAEEESGKKDYQIAYFQVGSEESSMHFEHRVAKIIAISPDGNNEHIVFTDLNEKYDLSRIYDVSPDSSKISCGFYEGGRGAYGALSVIDVATGKMETVVEFDYTQSESMELMADIYGRPVWSHDSKNIAYETVIDPFTENFSDGGISIVNIDTGDIREIDVNMEEFSSENEIFLDPVLFSADDNQLFNILHTRNPKMEEGVILGYFTRNEKLVAADISDGVAYEILNVSQFNGMEATFDDFNLFTQQNKIVFHVLGDFEEDGDIWICDSDGSNLTRLTDDAELREQQPSILDLPDSTGLIAYVGVGRYGTIASNFNAGNIYIINMDGSGKVEIDHEADASKPIFSPDGRYIAFIGYIFDSDLENIQSRQIVVYDTQSEETRVVTSGPGIFDLIGWIEKVK
jgi:Tol biopolymer transport system component